MRLGFGLSPCDVAVLGAQWNPLLLPGLKVWLEDSATAPANAVTSWTDRSGNSNHATQSTGTAKPTYNATGKNGRPTLSFDGGDFLQTPAIALTTFTFVVVWKSSSGGIIYEHGSNANTAGCYLHAPGGNTIAASRSSSVSAYTRATLADDTWRLTTHSCDGTHAGHTLRINGALQSLSSAVGNAPGTSSLSDVLNIGARNGASLFTTGSIALLVVCTPVLSAANVTLLEAYANGRFAVY